MYLDITLGGTQIAMIVLRLMGIVTFSWWIVLLPTIIWIVCGIIATATGRNDGDSTE